MIIKQLNLDHFGKFHDREIHLEKGINIVYGANESGKSTVHSFIQCMLFGTERLRGRGAGRIFTQKNLPGKAAEATKAGCVLSVRIKTGV